MRKWMQRILRAYFSSPYPMSSFMQRTLPVLLGATLFTGCLTIEENYTFKKDGSGTMEYVVDMSQLGQMMSTLGEMSEEGGGGGMKDMGTMDMSEQVAALKEIPGIRKVKLNSKQDWVQRLSFSFSDLDALNSALNALMPDSTGSTHTFFTREGNSLIRTNNGHAYEIGAGMAKDDDADGLGDEDGMDLAAMLESMKYRYSFSFAQEIGDAQVAEGVNKESANSKEVRMETDFKVIGRDPKALDLRIDLIN